MTNKKGLLALSPLILLIAMIALGWRPPADVPTVSKDCIVIDSSGIMWAFSRSMKMRSAKSANDLTSIISALSAFATSGKNSNAPMPRLPIKESLSNGVISALGI